MLEMIQQHHIKYLHEHKGVSLREISRELGHDFKTVQKYAYQKVDNLPPVKRKTKKMKIDPYKETVDQWLKEDMKAPKKQRHTGKRIYARLQEVFGDELDISYRTLQYYVSKKKTELYGTNTQAFLPLEHQAGNGQVDFGSCQYIDAYGKEQEAYFLTLSLPYSNGGFLQILPGQNQECLLQGLKQIFEHMNHVPKRLLFDNLSAAVITNRAKGEKQLVAQFQKFAIHYNFQVEFCNPNSGHEKGNVENKVGYLRRNLLVPIPQIRDMVEYNQFLLNRCDQNMNRSHYKKQKAIVDLYKTDLGNMMKLPTTSFDVGRFLKVKADKYGKIRHENNAYSTSPQFALKEVGIRITHDQVFILDEKHQVIVEHLRLYGQGKESMKWIPYLELISRRPKSVEQIPFFKTLPQPWQEYVHQSDNKKGVVALLSRMLESEGDIERATKALTVTKELGKEDPDSVLTTWYRLCNPILEDKEFQVPSHIQQKLVFKTNISSYDSLMGGGNQ